MFRRQRKPKIFGFKNAVKRGMRKILTFVKLKIVYYFQENNTEALVISKSLKFP